MLVRQKDGGRRRAGSRMPRNGLETPFITHSYALLTSPAWRSLSITARRILDRLEIEHMGKGGRHNGDLVTTYDDLVNAGCSRSLIAHALQELQDVGLLRVTQRGGIAMGHRMPSRYRLTYLPSVEGRPSNDFKSVSAEDVAEAASDRAAGRRSAENWKRKAKGGSP